MAAALLAALFSMGVFSAGSVGADVRGGDNKPSYDISSRIPGAEDVTLTVTFQVDADITSTARNVVVQLPAALVGGTDFALADHISVKQGSQDVGGVTTGISPGGSGAVTISLPADTDTDREVLEANTTTTVVIENLSIIASPAPDQVITVLQGEQTANAAVGTSMAIAFHPSVTDASVSLSSYTADEEDVTMTIDFSANGTQQVDITIATDYDLGMTDPDSPTDRIDNAEVKVEVDVEGLTLNRGLGNVADPTNILEITALTEEQAEAGIEITITGLNNPSTTKPVSVTFQQGTGDAIQPADDQVVTRHITNAEDVAVKSLMINPRDAGESPVTMTIEFESVVDITSSDTMIEIDLDDDFSGLSDNYVTATQVQDADDGAVEVGDVRTTSNGNVIYLVYDEDADANIERGTDVTVTVTRLTNPGEVGRIPNAVTVTQGGFASSAPASVSILGAAISTDTPGAAVRVEISTRAETAIPGGEDIVVELDGWGIPGVIDEEEVLVTSDQGNASEDLVTYNGFPSEVTVSGKKITIAIPPNVRGAGGETKRTQIPAGDYSIVFKQNAGLTNPTSRGNKDITVEDEDADDHEMFVTIKSKVSIDPKWVSRGGSVEVTGKGLKAGTATVHLDDPDVEDIDDIVLGSGAVVDGKVVVTIDTTTQRFIADAGTKDGEAIGVNTIMIYDASGHRAQVDATLGILPTVELDVSEVKRAGIMGVTVSDWYYGSRITNITIGGLTVDYLWQGGDEEPWESQGVSGGEAEFDIIVPPPVRLGTQEVTLVGSSYTEQGKDSAQDKLTVKVNVGAFDLTVTPSTAVTDQVIRIEGSGFDSESGSCIMTIHLGDEEIEESTSGNITGRENNNSCQGDVVKADSNGHLADSFKVPDGLKAGDYRVVVRDSSNRIGSASFTIPEPEIELKPVASQRGTTVTIVGSNFPAEDLITVTYGGETVTATTTDTVGKWRSTFSVPIDSTIGAEHEVEAKSEKKADGVDNPLLRAKATHTVPDEVLTVSPETVAPGSRLNVEASNLPLYTPVSILIGGIRAAGRVVGDDDASDGTGSYKRVLLVPQLTPGTHTVELVVHTVGADVNVATFVEIADIVTRPSDEAFEDLIENGTLTRVWYLEAATQTWSFFDPAPEFADFNTLTEVSTGQIVTIIMATQDEFQGRSLYVGSNNVAIE